MDRILKVAHDITEICKMLGGESSEAGIRFLFKAAETLEREANELEAVSGLSVKQITKLFLAGYEMRPSEATKRIMGALEKIEVAFDEMEADRILNGHGAEYEQHMMRRFVKAE